jgi:DNA-3-methyladenine glycosylase I
VKENIIQPDNQVRCQWANMHSLLMSYHDQEWGVPVMDDTRLFEMFSLDCFQAGLSWLTILKKRDAFRLAFDQFNMDRIARYSNEEIDRLLMNTGIVRNRMKITAVINNARKTQEIQKEFGSFTNYCWSFTHGKTMDNRWATMEEIPAISPASDNMSKDMKKRGFQFAGSTICYAFMQSAGMVNDHLLNCFRHNKIR